MKKLKKKDFSRRTWKKICTAFEVNLYSGWVPDEILVDQNCVIYKDEESRNLRPKLLKKRNLG